VNVEQFGHNGAQSHAFKAEQASRKLCVEDSLRRDAHLSKAGEVLACGVEYPFRALSHGGECTHVSNGRRVEQEGSRIPSVDLNEIGAL
jgi:hypothetical protein